MALLEGILVEGFVKAEATYDTTQAIVAGDAVGILKGSLKLEPFYNHEPRKEAVGTATLQGEIANDKGGKWSLQTYVKPNAAGTAPDAGELIKAAMGVETVVGATSVTYTLSDTVRNSLQIVKHLEDQYQEVANGCWVEEMSIDVQGGQAPILGFSGGYATHGWASADVVKTGSSIAYNATSLPLNDTGRGSLGPNGRIKFSTPADDAGTAGSVTSGAAETYDFSGAGSETLTIKVDGGAVQTVTFVDGDFSVLAAGTAAEVVARINTDTTGCTAVATTDVPPKVAIYSDTVGSTSSIQVTGGTANAAILQFSTDAVAGTAGTGYAVTATVDTAGSATATISPAIVSRAGHAQATAFVPWAPSRTESGTVLGGVGCDLTIDGTSYGFVSAKISVKNGLHGLNKEATATKPNRVAGGAREVTGEIVVYALNGATGTTNILGRAWASATHDIGIRVGPSTAAQHMHINIDECRFEVVPLDIPEAEEATFVLKLIGRQDSAAADEINIVFD